MDFKKFFLFFCTFSLYSQQDFFLFDKVGIEKVASIEKKFNSEEIFPRGKHVHYDKSFAQPIIYLRAKTETFPSMEVSYYYSKTDTTIKQISYVWNAQEMSDREKFFEIHGREFDRMAAIISRHIGKPQSTQDIIEKEDFIGTETHFEREAVWENDNCRITTLLLWSENHNVLFETTIKMKN